MSSFDALKPKIEQRPCPICGGKDYEWGFLTLAEYKPDRTRHLAMNAKMLRALLPALQPRGLLRRCSAVAVLKPDRNHPACADLDADAAAVM